MIENFLNQNDIPIDSLPEGRYYSSNFEDVSKSIHQKYKINFFHSQFIPSDYYGIGIYSDYELEELLKHGLISDFDDSIPDRIYEKLK